MIGLVRTLSGVAGMAKRRVFVVGVGMTKFEKPGRREDFDYPDMALEAGTKALEDAGISFDKVQQACVGYVYGDSTCGQRAVYGLGMTGIPVYNVNNNCSTGSTALFMAKQFIEGGIADCILALGFEKMQRGSLASQYDDRTNPLDKHVMTMSNLYGFEAAPVAPQMFGNAGRQYMKENNVKPETLAKIAVKNHKHSVNNPYSQFQDEYTLDEIMASQEIFAPLTKLQCCPTSDGSAAAIVASEEFVQKNNLEGQAVEILAQEMTTDYPDSFDVSAIKMVGFDMTKSAADKVYKISGLTPNDVDVIELHDCFSANELITYDALGLCEPGKAGELVESGNNTYGGKYVINPSGGLISKGHPLGATGLAQCSELCWQLRGLAGKRQVAGAKVGLQHNIGLGGAAVISMYRLGFPDKVQARTYSSQAGSDSSSEGSGGSQLGDSKFMCTALFTEIQRRLVTDGPDFVKKVNGVFCFKLKNEPDGTHWIIDAKNGNGAVKFGTDDKADCTMTASDKDLFNMFSGKLNPQQAFFTGKLRISGDMALAMKLKEFQMKGGPAKL